MINWELLYNKLLEVEQSEKGERHHTTPIHDGGLNSRLVVLLRRYHTLAHYIRYRWKGQAGDLTAYRMMSGQQQNPMHNDLMREKHTQAVNTVEYRLEKSIAIKQRWLSPISRSKLVAARREWIDGLDDKKVLTKHLQSEAIKEKRKNSLKIYAKNNAEKLKDKATKTAAKIKAKNLTLTEGELKLKYGRGSGINNPKWRGFVRLEDLNGNARIFNSIKEMVEETKITLFVVHKYKNTNECIKKGKFQNYKININKD